MLLRDNVYENLRSDILTCRLAPGDDMREQELAERKRAWTAPAAVSERGYVSLYVKHVEQAHLGADFDFLKGASGPDVSKDSH